MTRKVMLGDPLRLFFIHNGKNALLDEKSRDYQWNHLHSGFQCKILEYCTTDYMQLEQKLAFYLLFSKQNVAYILNVHELCNMTPL